MHYTEAEKFKCRYVKDNAPYRVGDVIEVREGIARTLVSFQLVEIIDEEVQPEKDVKPKRARRKPSGRKKPSTSKRKPSGRSADTSDGSSDGEAGA